MSYPFERYAFVPMLEQVEELEGKGLLDGPGGPGNVVMYNSICCLVDRDLEVEVSGKRVISGWTQTTMMTELTESIGIKNQETGVRVMKRLRDAGVVNREWDGDVRSYKYQLKVYERNHDRLESLGEVKCKTPFEVFYCLPYEERTAALKAANMLDVTVVALYDSVLSYVDRKQRVVVGGKGYVSGWTMVLAQASISRRAGLTRDRGHRVLNRMVRAGLIERQKIGNRYRYRVVIWRDALERIKTETKERSEVADREGGDKMTEDGGGNVNQPHSIDSSKESSKEPPPSPSTSNDKQGGDYLYLKEKARELTESFNRLFRNNRFMSQRLKRIWSSKILESLKDLLSEEKIRSLGEKAMEMAVRVHEEVFHRMIGKESAPYSPGWLFHENAALMISSVMSSLLGQTKRRKPQPIMRPRVDNLDPLAKKLYDKYVKGGSSNETETQSDGRRATEPVEDEVKDAATSGKETETPKTQEKEKDEGVTVHLKGGERSDLVAKVRSVIDKVSDSLFPEARVALLRELCDMGDTGDIDILRAYHNARSA